MASIAEQIKALKDEKAQRVSEARQIVDRAEAEKRVMTSEEETNWRKAHDDEQSMAQRIDRLIEQAETEARDRDLADRIADLNSSAGVRAGRPDTTGAEQPPGDEQRTKKEAWDRYLRYGMRSLNPDQQAYMQKRQVALTPEHRAQGVDVDTAGGFLTENELSQGLVEAMLRFGGMRRAGCTVLTTTTGNDLPIPTNNDTSNEGAILSENTASSEQDLSYGQVILHAYMYTSKMIKVSKQLLQDASFDPEGFLKRKLGERLGRITNRHFTVGDGASKPYGIVSQAAVGKTAASATAIALDEIYDLEHSVDPDYREDPTCGFMFHDNILLAIKKLKDGNGRYLWQAGVRDREPDTFDGKAYTVNQHMASSIATGARTMAFGAFSNYYIRDVQGVQILRLDERYAEALQVAFLGFSRHDGVLVDAGTNPVKCLVQA
jgi:HK97 family phage major capsid protein